MNHIHLLRKFIVIAVLSTIGFKGMSQTNTIIPSLPQGKNITIVFDAQVNAGTASGTVIGNTATVTANNAGTVNSNTINYTVVTCPGPTITASGPTTFCAGGSVTLTAIAGDLSDPATSYKWYQNGSLIVGATASTYQATTSGNYVVEITNTCAGTIQSAPTVITVNPIPTATISGTTAVCVNGTVPVVTFTGVGGTAPYSFNYKLNNGATVSVTTTVGNSVTVAQPTNAAGTFTYTLLSVEDGTSTHCTQAQTGTVTIQVNPLPTATMTGNTVVCQGITAPLITFTGSGGTAPYSFNYKINNGGTLSVTTTSGNSVTVPQSTATAGTFTYTLVSVTDASSTQCTQAQTGTATIQVNPTPSATITGSTAVCQGASAPIITFTGSGGTAPYTFNYKLNNAATTSVTTSVGNSVTVTQPTTSAGTYTYTLVSVQDASATACTQAQTGTVTIQVNPLPAASIIGTTTVCQSATAPVVTFTGSGGTAPYSFNYKINNGGTLSVTTTSGNSVTVSQPTTSAGTFTYTLVNVTDATSTACTQAQTGTVTIIVNPTPTVNAVTTQVVCNGSPTTAVTFSGSVGGTTYNWTNNNTSIGLAASGSGTINSFNAVNLTAGVVTATIVVTPVTNSGTTCSGATTTFTITVNPTATVTVPTNKVYCAGTIVSTGSLNFVANTAAAGSTFTWTNTNAAIGLATSGSGSTLPTFTTTNGGTTPIQGTISVTPTYTNGSVSCTGTPSTFTITVNPLPGAAMTGTVTVCRGDAAPLVTFTGGSGTAPYSFNYKINNGATLSVTTTSGNSVTVAQPTTIAGTFTYTLVSVTDASSTACTQAQTGTVTIKVNPLPTATIAGTTTACTNGAPAQVTFTGANGTAPYTFNYTLNGATQSVTTSVGSSVNVTVPNGNVGSFVYILTGVTDASVAACSAPQSGTVTVTVTAPNGVLSGTTAVCLNGAQPQITFTGSNGTAPYTFTYSINGGASTTVSTTGASSVVTVNAPTNVSGQFVYNLLNVSDAAGCSFARSGTTTITVNTLPTASIAGTTTVCYGATVPGVTFAGTTGKAPYTFTYNINGGTATTVTTTSGSAVTVNAPTNVAGSFTYNLVSVSDANGCSQAQGGSATITVNAQFVLSVVPTQNLMTCFGGSTTITVTPSAGGVGTITYTLTRPGGSTTVIQVANPAAAVFSNIIAGSYTITAVNGNAQACVVTNMVTVQQPNIIAASLAATQITCFGAANGQINVSSVTGGTPGYSVSNDGGSNYITYTGGNSPTFSGLAPGIYNIYIRDNNGCVQPIGSVTITQPSQALTLGAAGVVSATCSATNGSITVKANGGNGSYMYSITKPNNTTAQASGTTASVTFSNLGAGTYTISVVDGNGCSIVQTVTVNGGSATAPDLVVGSSSSSNTFIVGASSIFLEYNITNFSGGTASGVVLRVTKPNPFYLVDLVAPAAGNDNARWSRTTNGDGFAEFTLLNDPNGNNNIGCGGSSGVLRIQLNVTRGAGATGKGVFTITGSLRSSVADGFNADNSTVNQFNAQ